jgi:uncharacterized protein YicC (UPF0701 family)
MASTKELKKAITKKYYALADEVLHLQERGSAEASEKAEKMLDEIAENMDEALAELNSLRRSKAKTLKADLNKMTKNIEGFVAGKYTEIEKLFK